MLVICEEPKESDIFDSDYSMPSSDVQNKPEEVIHQFRFNHSANFGC